MTALQPGAEGTMAMDNLTREEVGLATRNHGFLLETLRYPVTPVGMHYLLTHYDVPSVDPATAGLPEGLQRKIFYGNAQALYPKMPALRAR